MNKFSTSSKPKVLYYGSHNIKAVTIELVTVYEINLFIINYYKPDLIITDTADIECLRTASYDIRKKWVLYDPDADIHAQAVKAGLIPNNDLISIFTSAYNTELKIVDTYRSLQSQAYTNWEWVIVDDSTHHNTAEIIKNLTFNDPRVKYYKFDSLSNGNIGEAKYRAAMLCSGAYLVELDHDDVLMDDCLLWIYRAFKSNKNIGFVYSDCVEYDVVNKYSLTYPDGFAFGFESHYDYLGYKPYTVAPINPLTIRHIVSIPNHVRAWRSVIYRMIGGHNRLMRICDDYELIVRTFLHTKFMYIPKMLYIQRYDGNNSQNQSDNRADIQYRVNEIVSFYNPHITLRFEQLGIEDLCEGMQATIANKLIDKSKLKSCNEILDINKYTSYSKL